MRLRGGSEHEADERLALIHDIKDLLGLSKNPRMLSFIADLPAGDLQAAKDRTGRIGSADLYRLLVDRWLTFEVHRRFELDRDGQGSHQTRQQYRAQLRAALDALAVTLWETTEQGVDTARLERTAAETLAAWKELCFDSAQAAHALGSGSLLVRTGDDAFGFIHSSVMEYLVAAQAAARLAADPEDTELLDRREMSPLMADFFGGVAGQDAALGWALATLRDRNTTGAGAANALAVAVGWGLGIRLARVDLAGQDLRGRNLTGQDLIAADLTGVTLAGARLRGTNLTHALLVDTDLSHTTLDGVMLAGATLAGANLGYATVDGVTLTGADLTGADLTGATFRRCDLRGVRVEGSRWDRAALVGTEVDAGHLEAGPLASAVRADVVPAEPVVGPLMPQARGVVFSRDGAWLAAAAGPDVLLVDVRAWRVVRVLIGHDGPVYAVGFDPAGGRLASAGADGGVRVWDVATGAQHHRLTGHRGTVRAVGFDPAGARLASAGADGTVRIWDAATGAMLATMLALPEGGWATLLPDGSYKLDGEPSGRFWWVIGQHRFEPGELDGFSPNVRRLAPDDPIPGMAPPPRPTADDPIAGMPPTPGRTADHPEPNVPPADHRTPTATATAPAPPPEGA